MPRTVQIPAGENRLRWGAEQRLEFLEFRLFWEGCVNRSDITGHFGVSVPQASNDLAQYRELAPDNLAYDSSRKRYVPSATFVPRFLEPNAERYLSQLKAIADGALKLGDTWMVHVPEADAMPIPRRRIEPDLLKRLLEVIREHQSIEVHYQSMSPSRPDAVWRRITPHAFGFDGLRWHVRALCHLEGTFKDFILSRCRGFRSEGASGADPQADVRWRSTFDVVLQPNPLLSVGQRRAVALDYDMEGERLVIIVRQALLYYFQKRLRLDVGPAKDRPAETPLVVVNRVEFDHALNAAMG